MNRQNTKQPGWSEDDVESLLIDFFRHEMPAELRAEPQRVSIVQKRPTGRDSRSKTAAGIGVAALTLLLAVTVLSPTGRRAFRGTGDTVNTEKDDGSLLANGNKKSGDRNSTAVVKKEINDNKPAAGRALPIEVLWPWELGQAQFDRGTEEQKQEVREWLREQYNFELHFPFDEDGKKQNSKPDNPPRLPEQQYPRR